MTKGKPIRDTSNMVEGQHKRREREANPMDIVARLHKWPDMTPHACIEAANEIERLRKHIEELGSPSTMHQNFMAKQAALESALRTAEEKESNLRRLVKHLNIDIKVLSDNSVEIAALRTAREALELIRDFSAEPVPELIGKIACKGIAALDAALVGKPVADPRDEALCMAREALNPEDPPDWRKCADVQVVIDAAIARQKTYWLIERRGCSPPQWLRGRGDYHNVTTDVGRAERFSSEEDAFVEIRRALDSFKNELVAFEHVGIDAALAGERGERVRHKKRGTTYRILTQRGKLQTSKPLADMVQLVIYQCEQTGELWARPYSEFMDGRFEPLPSKDAAHE
jgi:hypothetical protein